MGAWGDIVSGAAAGGEDGGEGGSFLEPGGGTIVGGVIGAVIGGAIGWVAGPRNAQMAAPGNHVDTGIAEKVHKIQSEAVREGKKRPDKCEVLEALIESGVISAREAKSTSKAWGCSHSRASKDKCNK